MSNSLNKIEIIGNVTRDPEIKTTPGGAKVATLSVATNRKWKDASGTIQDEVEYHNVVVWRHLADLAEQYINKGKKLYIEGYNKTRVWDHPEYPVKMHRTEIVGENIIFLSNNASE